MKEKNYIVNIMTRQTEMNINVKAVNKKEAKKKLLMFLKDVIYLDIRV